MHLRAAYAQDAQWRTQVLALKAWQAARLSHTYTDLLASPRYRTAAQFFLEELYGARDFSQRDADVGRILPKMTRLLPEAALAMIAGAVELDELSETLDTGTAAAHGAGPISGLSYAAAYRAASTREARTRQIVLMEQIGRALDTLTRVPMLLTTLKLMRGPARLAGLAGLQQFLEKGFMTCKQMRGADQFLGIIARRETALMERLLDTSDNAAADPFAGLAETG